MTHLRTTISCIPWALLCTISVLLWLPGCPSGPNYEDPPPGDDDGGDDDGGDDDGGDDDGGDDDTGSDDDVADDDTSSDDDTGGDDDDTSGRDVCDCRHAEGPPPVPAAALTLLALAVLRRAWRR